VWDKSVFTVLSELLSLFTTKGRSTWMRVVTH
jgi:hypothetical protein